MSALKVIISGVFGITNTLLNFLFPPTCVWCHRPGSLLCLDCQQLIQFYPQNKAKLLQKNDCVDQLLVLAYYQPPVKNLITTLKYKRVIKVTKKIAELLFLHLSWPNADYVTFVPSSKMRISNRGFNQAQEIAREFSMLTKIPLKPLLIKNKHTRRQASLKDPGERLTNLKDSIKMLRPKPDLTNKNIILIDDVVSTGTTLNACAQRLKQQGAGTITAMTVARS